MKYATININVTVSHSLSYRAYIHFAFTMTPYFSWGKMCNEYQGKIHTYKLSDRKCFFANRIRHGLIMMIPLILTGGVACALMNLPFIDYHAAIGSGNLLWLYAILNAIYKGTFGFFSLLLVILLSLCYGMERNETQDKVASYVIVALGAYGVQLNIGSTNFHIASLDPVGSFSAVFIALSACYLYEKLRNVTALSINKYSVGMEGLCANAIQTLLPMTIIIVITVLFTRILHLLFGVYNLHELFSLLSCSLFEYVENNFASGLLYTFLLHLLWFCGFHGSNLLEPVAQAEFTTVSEQTIFSKSFFDTYVVMGGCGTTICVLLLLLISCFFSLRWTKAASASVPKLCCAGIIRCMALSILR